MMPVYKFKIGDKVAFNDVTKDYRDNNGFTIKYRKKYRNVYIDRDGDEIIISHNSYSCDSTGWYLENCLERY